MLSQINDFITMFLFVCLFVFPQECPSGLVDEETFKNIYAQFFPQGGTACDVETVVEVNVPKLTVLKLMF